MNVLITSVSRKVWLVKAFRVALRRAGIKGRVVSVDADPLSAGLYASDRQYLVPRSDNRNFISFILKVCKKEKINLIVPTRDAELLIFAKNRIKFMRYNITVAVSDKAIVELCNDKYKFYQFLKKNDFQTPIVFGLKHQHLTAVTYPAMIKPRFGSGGKYCFKVENEKQFKFFINFAPQPIIQEFIKGQEYTVDLSCSLNSNIIAAVVRKRIEVVAGESYKGITVNDEGIIDVSVNFARKIKARGHITLQFIKNCDSAYLIEVNPRFGGAAALGIKAGANTPLFLIQELNGVNLKPHLGKMREGLIMLRYTKDIFLSGRDILR